MSSDRRKFIKELVVGSAGIAMGGTASGSFPSLFSSSQGNGTIPVFPFFRFASKYSIGEYLPKDQGGKFIQMAILKTEDDRQITELIRNGMLETTYDNPVGWSRFEKTEIEKSVWLNRFYFLPSFARMYQINGDRSYLDDMMSIIRKWIADNPRLPDSHKTTYNWRDMQVAWRSIHLSWCWYLGEKGLTTEEKTLITGSLKEHAHILATGFGQAKLNEFNHQSHGALAMLYLGILFPMLDEAEELRRKSIVILEHHLEKAFYADGGNVEQMFGYYPFEAHIFRDAYLLCRANGIEPPANSLPMLRKMVNYICSIARPDNTMPQVNDSFEMPVLPLLDTINEIIGEEICECKDDSIFFPDTQIAVLRHGLSSGWYILANPASVIGAHAHAGRLAFELWYKGRPLLIDSGCCNYDDPALVKWYRTSRAHNTVIIDGVSDAATSTDSMWVARRETKNRITKWMPGDEVSYLTMDSPSVEATNSLVKWSRTIAVVRGRFVVISDIFEAAGDHRYEILFHFPPSDVTVNESRKSLIMRSEGVIEVLPAKPSLIQNITNGNGMISRSGISIPAPAPVYTINGKDTIQSVFVVLPNGNGDAVPKVNLRQKKNEKVLTVRDAEGLVTRLAFRGEDVRLI
jgi:hypothetical protein